MARSTLTKLGVAKLASSGLTTKDAEVLHISEVSREQVLRLDPKFKPLRALKLDYLTVEGQPMFDWPGAKRQAFRVRYLEELQGLDALEAKKAPRYAQPEGTAPVVYFPQNQDWRTLVKDVSQQLIVTEGELKAAKACKEGFPCIGLGGVYSWRSTKLGLPFVKSLEAIDWRKRNVYLCFDSDVQTNRMVQVALKEFADELIDRGAVVHVARLPELKDLEKVGIDDYFVAEGAAARAGFASILHASELFGLTRALWEMNDKFVYVRDPGIVYEASKRMRLNPSAFKDHAESTRKSYEGKLAADGSMVAEPTSAAAHWLRWPVRREVPRLTYAPGQPESLPNSEMNTWPGWGCEPKRGDVSPWHELLDHLFKGTEPAARKWFEQWAAYPIQYPGVKMFSTAVFHGIRHGTGKSFVGYTLGRIYGKNFTEVSQMDIHNHFNEWVEGKQFVLGDDVTGPNRRADADFLKKLITQRELRVNAKYMPTYVVPDCVNYFFTANHPDAFFLEDDDRRFFVHEVLSGPLELSFYKGYELWLDTTGASALFHHLLHVDTSDFDPSGPALRTSAKERMTTNVQSDLASWVRMLRANPDGVLRMGDIIIEKDLFTTAELLGLYDRDQRTGTTANGLGRELARAGVRQVLDGAPVRTPDGQQARYYAVRRPEKWLGHTVTMKAVSAHVAGFAERFEKSETKKKGKY